MAVSTTNHQQPNITMPKLRNDKVNVTIDVALIQEMTRYYPEIADFGATNIIKFAMRTAIGYRKNGTQMMSNVDSTEPITAKPFTPENIEPETVNPIEDTDDDEDIKYVADDWD